MTKTKTQKKKDKKQRKISKTQSISLRDLLEAGCHFGHKKSKTHPSAKKYVYMVRDGIAIFDLVKTKEKLEQAQKFIKKLVKDNKKIVFIGTKRQAKEIVREEAKKVGMPYVTHRWLGGTITNWKEIKANSIDKLNELVKNQKEGKFKGRPKKEQAEIRREIARLRRMVGGLMDLDQRFDAIFVTSVKKEKTAIKEARMRGVPIVAIADSNADFDLVDYPIPANDDAIKSIQLLVREIAKSIS